MLDDCNNFERMDTPSIKTIICRQLKNSGDGVNFKLFKDGHNVWNLLDYDLLYCILLFCYNEVDLIYACAERVSAAKFWSDRNLRVRSCKEYGGGM